MTDPARVLFRNPSYDGQLVRTLAAATVASADLGEAMATARQVGKLTGQSWYDAWSRAAARARSAAETAHAAGDQVTARHAFLRASEYYRQAYYFVRADLDDRRLQDGYRGHVSAFVAAAGLMDSPPEPARIPYEGTTLAGYLFAPDATGAARPTVVFPCGYDSTAEAGWGNVPPALQRGYNVLVFEGPGQGQALYTQRLYLRPDFERVLSPVLDWLLARREVDTSRVVLIGRSFGGYLAPRAAAFDTRLAALVCDPAQPDMGARLPGGWVGRLAGPVVTAQSRISAGRAEFFGARMAAHGVTSIEEYFAELRRYTMLAHAAQISCPTLIIEADNDFAGGGGQALRDAMTAPAELVRLTAAEGADGHCGGLGQEVWAEVVYGWLRKSLAAVAGAPGPGVIA
jgi:alpha-beta hydrolase superfamily lysophospholipase